MFEVNKEKLPVFYQNLAIKELVKNQIDDYVRVVIVNNNKFEKGFYGTFSSKKNLLYKPISRILTYEQDEK